MKLPKLYGHFMEHKALNASIAFGDFLSMHYLGNDPDDHDDEKDMELPFKRFDVHSPGFLYTPPYRTFVPKPHYEHGQSDFAPERAQVYYNPSLGSLFRPPKA